MNAVVPIKDEMVLPRRYGLVPENMAEAMKLAEMMAGAKLVPQALQKSPADCLMVIQQAIRWNMDPFAVAQECSVIQGKLMHSGKLVAAVVNAHGNLANRLSFSYDGDGDDRVITVTGRLANEAEPRTVAVKFKDARTQNRVWDTQPDQQLMYHGVRVWARRHTPELMLGVYSPEEFDEPLTPPRNPKAPAPNVILHDPQTGEIEDDDQTEDRITDELIAQAQRENETDAVKQAGMRCADPRFHKFLEETNSAWKIMKEGTPTERAAELVRAIVGVKSRKDITPDSEAAEHWHDLEGRFQAWLRA